MTPCPGRTLSPASPSLIRRILLLAVHVCSDKIQHLPEPPPEHSRIYLHRLDIKNGARLEGPINMFDLLELAPLAADPLLPSAAPRRRLSRTDVCSDKIKHLLETPRQYQGTRTLSVDPLHLHPRIAGSLVSAPLFPCALVLPSCGLSGFF